MAELGDSRARQRRAGTMSGAVGRARGWGRLRPGRATTGERAAQARPVNRGPTWRAATVAAATTEGSSEWGRGV